LRINRREIKQIYHKYKPKKRGVPPPEPFEPDEQFLDFVELLDPLAPALPLGSPSVRCIERKRPYHPTSTPLSLQVMVGASANFQRSHLISNYRCNALRGLMRMYVRIACNSVSLQMI
ncbi:MAG TPA: hypothetical protein VNW73_03315, partial [Ktedonobacteraceae bacterium]|nr:hypothetical protein [Ktedonobacteraceae bacterium]